MKISIIIPVFNTGKLLYRCIESILQNGFADYEIIIVDDGSDRQTANICDECVKLDSRIIVYHTQNKGVSCARNFGVEKANGEYIAFIDGDDTIENTYLSVLYELAVSTNADISMCGYKECLKSGKQLYFYKTGKEYIWKDEEILDTFFVKNLIAWNVWGKLFKSRLAKNITFPEGKKIAEDMFYVYQACAKAKIFVYKDIVLYNYIDSVSSAMASKDVEKFFEEIDLLNVILNENLNGELIQEVEFFYYKNLLWLIKFILSKNVDITAKNKIMELQTFFRKQKVKFSHYWGIRLKIEYLLFKNSYLLFKWYTRIYNWLKTLK